MEINAVIRSPVENMVGVLISQGKTKILWGVKRLNTKGKIMSISTMSFSYRLPSSKTLKLVISKKKKKGLKLVFEVLKHYTMNTHSEGRWNLRKCIITLS